MTAEIEPPPLGSCQSGVQTFAGIGQYRDRGRDLIAFG